ncbi:MAG: hypothetical protein HKN26_07540 [Acidimicrobiales bacterium]|nr:hypothetical protein [Acidimicrobiales bacterium]
MQRISAEVSDVARQLGVQAEQPRATSAVDATYTPADHFDGDVVELASGPFGEPVLDGPTA